jgi:hypothetical protein
MPGGGDRVELVRWSEALSATAPTPEEIRQARAYLQKQGVRSSDINPKQFAAVSHETGKSFRDTLNWLARLLSGGQGQGPSPATTKNVDVLAPANAIGGDEPDYAEGAR